MVHREGQRFDDYQLIHLLGAGAFGEVYEAEHMYDHEQVAIKIIKQQLSPTTLAEFLREARAFRLKHPHIVPLLDFGIEEKEQLPFLVMPFLPNGTLLQRHPRGTRLAMPIVISYVEQLASALSYVHERRVIHRDVKPANVLLSAQNELLLSDFGIIAVAHSERSMRTQDIIGTAIYMAPEQSLGKPQPASDQYSLAIMAYEWLCGTPPFQGNYAQLTIDHYQKIPPSPRLLNPQLTQKVEAVLLKALAKEPANRFANIQAFAQALSQTNPASAPTIYSSPPTIPVSPMPQSPQDKTKTKEDWVNRGNELYNLKRYDEALDAYNRAIALDLNYALAYYNKGVVLERFKRYDEALDAYNRAIQLNPNSALAYNGKGSLLDNLKRYDEALDTYNRAIDLDPNYANAYVGKGIVLRKLKRYDEAFDTYNRAIDLDPNYANAYNNKGIVLRNLKRYDEALDAYNRAIQLDPNDASTYNNKGIALKNLKRYDEALDTYNRAIALDPNYALAYRNKGIALYDLKRHEEALDAYNRAIALDPNSVSAFVGKGNLLYDLKQYKEALDAYNRAIVLDPNYTNSYVGKGNVLRNLKRYDEALDAYNRAIQLDPNHALTYHNKGLLLDILQRPEEARAAKEKARQLGYNG